MCCLWSHMKARTPAVKSTGHTRLCTLVFPLSWYPTNVPAMATVVSLWSCSGTACTSTRKPQPSFILVVATILKKYKARVSQRRWRKEKWSQSLSVFKVGRFKKQKQNYLSSQSCLTFVPLFLILFKSVRNARTWIYRKISFMTSWRRIKMKRDTARRRHI